MMKGYKIVRTGLLSTLALLVFAGSAFAAEGTVKLTKEGLSQDSLAAFDKIEVNTFSADVDFEPGMAFSIEVLNNPNMPISYSSMGGKLIIEQDPGSRFPARTHVKVYYPSGSEFTSANINTASGDVELNNFSINDLKVNSASGDVELEQIKVNDLTLSTISGDIDFDYTRVVKGEVQSVSGEISGDDVFSAQSLKVSTTSSNVELDGIFEGDTSISTISGRVEMEIKESQSKYNIQLSSISGRFYVNQNKLSGSITQTGAKNNLKISSTSGGGEIEFYR